MSTKPTEISCTLTELAAVARVDVPSKVSHTRATSMALFPIAPMVSNEAVKLNTPFNETEPGVSFKAYSAATAAGETRDPEVSLPSAIGPKPEAIPTAEPVDEPMGAYYVSLSHSMAHTLTVSPLESSPSLYPVGM